MFKTIITIVSFVLLFCGGNIAKNLRDKAAGKDLPETGKNQWMIGRHSLGPDANDRRDGAQTARLASKYAYVIITYSKQERIPEEKINRPYGPPEVIASHYRTVKKQWVSPIKGFQIFGEKYKQRLMEEMERGFHFTYRDLRVVSRQCFDFKSYSDASRDIEYRKNENAEEFTFNITDGS
jgi:hypothetical protein